MSRYYLEDGTKIKIDDSKPLGRGGEGAVYKLAGNQEILVKIYNQRALDRMPEIESKIKAMVQKKPGLLNHQGLTIIAWPQRIVYTESRKFIGYVMSRVQAKNQLSHVITPGLQKKKFPNISWYDRVVTAINLSLVMDYLHKNDTVIGDINTSDFFVYPELQIGVVDTDSFQLLSADNKVYHCNVFTPDYTPPEVVRASKNKKQLVRVANNDNYGLAILIFQILMMGVHPFSARIKQTMNFDGNAINYCMENEIFPYRGNNSNIIPPKNALPFSFFPKEIQDLFIRAFNPHKKDQPRPTAQEWVASLRVLKDNIKNCRRKKTHQYPNHFKKCPLCLKEKTKDFDYLVNHFKSISTLYVRYDTDTKPFTVNESIVVDETLLGKVYLTRKKKTNAFIFTKGYVEKYKLEERLKHHHANPLHRKLQPYFVMPEKLLYKDGHVVGYTFKAKEKMYRLSSFVKSTRLGKLKITDKTKVQVTRKITEMFKVFEKHRVVVELHQMFIDAKLNLYIPDLVLCATKDEKHDKIYHSRVAYTPQEYYYALQYKSYLDEKKQQEAMTEAEDQVSSSTGANEATETIIEMSKPLDDDETTNSEQDDFVFEKSLRVVQEIEEEAKVVVPPKVESYDPYGKETIRFQLAVIIHTILQRTHPFTGTYSAAKRPENYFIENNIYLHKLTHPNADIDRKAKLIEGFPNAYQQAMKNALHVTKPTAIKRPSASQWQHVLHKYQRGLRPCHDSEYHHYHKSVRSCPECEKGKTTDNDAMRAFYEEERTRPIDFFIQGNRIFNKGLLAALFLGLLLLVHHLDLTAYHPSATGPITVDTVLAGSLGYLNRFALFMASSLWVVVSLLWIIIVFINLFMPKRISKIRRRYIWKNIKTNMAYAVILVVMGVFIG